MKREWEREKVRYRKGFRCSINKKRLLTAQEREIDFQTKFLYSRSRFFWIFLDRKNKNKLFFLKRQLFWKKILLKINPLKILFRNFVFGKNPLEHFLTSFCFFSSEINIEGVFSSLRLERNWSQTFFSLQTFLKKSKITKVSKCDWQFAGFRPLSPTPPPPPWFTPTTFSAAYTR